MNDNFIDYKFVIALQLNIFPLCKRSYQCKFCLATLYAKWRNVECKMWNVRLPIVAADERRMLMMMGMSCTPFLDFPPLSPTFRPPPARLHF